MGDDGGPKQVADLNYHTENHTAAQTCGWTANALRGEGTCYKHAFIPDRRRGSGLDRFAPMVNLA